MWSSEPHEGVSKAKEVHVPSFLSYFKTLNSCPVLGIESLTSCFKVKLYTNWVNFVLLKSGLILLMTSCRYYSTVRQGWVDCPSCISVYCTCIMFICDGRGTRQRLDSIYIWMAKKVLREKYPASKLSYLGEWSESHEAHFTCPNRRACSQATGKSP